MLFFKCICLAGAEPRTYHLIDNFSRPFPSGDSIECSIEEADARVGLAAARVRYRFDVARRQRRVQIVLPAEARPIPTTGTLKLWVKGHGSGNQLQLQYTHAEIGRHHDGGRYLHRHRAVPLPVIVLDFDDWREQSLPVKDLPPGRVAYLSYVFLHLSSAKEPQTEGELLLDDLRLYPEKGQAPTSAALYLAGPTTRSYAPAFEFLADLRNFGAEPFTAQTHIRIVDRNDNLVAEREFETKVAAHDSQETRLRIEPENLHVFLPPFRITGDLVSPDLPQLSARLDQALVMGNSWLLFDDFANLHGRWFTSGMAFNLGQNNQIFGEEQHAWARTQTSVAISRVSIAPSQSPKDKLPPGRYAMQIDYSGQCMVYNGIHRYLPGDAYRLGVWVRGDGSGSALHAVVLDFSAAGSTFYTWKRSFSAPRLCTLDFEGWRYVEAPLPGNGVGPRTPRGSTHAIDFPLDLSAFAIVPRKDRPSGSVQIGPIFLHTQQSNADALSVQVGYDDPNHDYAPERGAWATVQNGWRVGARKVDTAWALLDRDDEVIARGRETFELGPMEQRSFPIDLKRHAKKIASRLGPLRLQVTASDAKEAATAEAQLILAKPDSVALVSDFEAERGYLGLRAFGVTAPPPPSEPAAKTSAAQKHSGKRSLALPWEQGRPLFVSVDPPLPGVPSEVSMWVHGDGSGVLFYPLIGDQFGVVSGVNECQWDLFLPRTEAGPLQNAVKVDWQGWREVKFRLPVIPQSWKEEQPVLPFVPSYPLGVHLAVSPTKEVSAPKGTIYVDDLRVHTHLPPTERLTMRVERLGESNLVPAGSVLRITVVNSEAPGPGRGARWVELSGGLYDWRGQPVLATETVIALAPGASKSVVVASKTAPGAYALRLVLKEGKDTVDTIAEDILVADAASLLGGDWQAALRDPAKLRLPLRDRFAFVQHDWDWAEFQPGNLQAETVLKCAAQVKKLGQEPYVLLGYSTYWSASSGYEDLRQDQLAIRNSYGPGGRDWGHAVDTFHVPERMDDWENYVLELMRLAGAHVSGWILWNTPDSKGSLGVPPAKFAEMIRLTDKWRRRYCPKAPLLLGGLSRNTAVPYLTDLTSEKALDHFSGVNLRVDAGVISPEDGQLPEYLEELLCALRPGQDKEKSVLLTDLDWAVEKGDQGLDAFDQTAYLVRAAFLLDRLGVHPTFVLHNEDLARVGFGMIYKKELTIPPLSQKLPAFQFKPAWLGLVRARKMLAEMQVVDEIIVQDIVPGRTRCVLYEGKADKKPVAIIWRNNDPGAVSFAAAGLSVTSVADIFGAPVAHKDGWYEVGKMPAAFMLNPAKEPLTQALARMHVRDAGRDPSWPQRVIAAFTPTTGGRQKYEQTGGKESVLAGRTTVGRQTAWPGLVFAKGGHERFETTVPEGAGLLLRKRYYLDETGQTGEVFVNGQSRGDWNLKRTATELSSGLRESGFLVHQKALAGASTATVEIRYPGPANTAGWTVFAYSGGPVPLSAFGPVHADSTVAPPRIARNIVGLPLGVGKKSYTNGLGVFARSLLEYSLNKQFRRFTAEVGIDSITKGKGSVVFEVYADDQKLWASPIMSGLDDPQKVDLDVTGVNRLRLIVNDGGDGNSFDAANWAEASLE